jgi:all-trans-8'-apo-beta-carotenal 15,15'-oxygenase
MLTLQPAVARIFDRAGSDTPRVRLQNIDGVLPALPDGTWYLNGPGRFQRAGQSYQHWLDGDGLIRAVRFESGMVSFASRFVRTRKYEEETEADRPLYRTFGSAFPGDRLNSRQIGLESPANIAVIKYGPRLMALGEQGEPWLIDPDTLSTGGPYSFSGALTAVTPFAAHAKVDPATGDLFNFGVSFAHERPELNVFRFDAAGMQLFRSRVSLHCSCSIHDFALSPSYAVFHVSPYVLDMSAIRNGATVLRALSWQPELGSRIVLVARATGKQVCSIAVDGRYSLHTINCCEKNGQVVFDVMEMPAPVYDAYTVPQLFARPIETTPVRLRIEPATGVLVACEQLAGDDAPEFASVEAGTLMHESNWFWALGMSRARTAEPKFFDELIRFDWRDPAHRDIYVAPAGVLLGGEPLILQDWRGGHWALCQMLDARDERGGFAAFDAFDLRRGPVATLWLDTPTPMAFHGTFVPRQQA